MTVLCPVSPKSFLFALSIGCALIATPAHAEESWESNSDVLQFTKPAEVKITYPWWEQVRAIMNRALNSPDQARDTVNLHTALGTKAQTTFAKYVGPLKITANQQNGVQVRQSVMKSMRLYAQKETKGDIFPQSWKDGLRFNIGGGGPAPSAVNKGYVYNGNPEMRYGLKLTDIQPSGDSLKLASNGMDDYEILAHAPKAKVVYEIGEVYPDGYARSFPANVEAPPVYRYSITDSLPALPDFKFSGRMAPRGLPGPGSPLPPQSIFLDQAQGYYQVEAQMTGNLRQENVLHRFRLPVYGKMNYRQERNKDWIFTKSTFESIYNNDQGFVVNLERYHLEKRYQLGFQFHRLINHFELYAHVPDAALEGDQFWHQHRWETRFDFHF